MPRPSSQVIRQIENLFGDLYAAEEVETWLRTPQSLLDGRRPIDLIEAGRGETVIEAVHEILDGVLT